MNESRLFLALLCSNKDSLASPELKMGAKNILKRYLLNATFHGAKFIVDEQYHMIER